MIYIWLNAWPIFAATLAGVALAAVHHRQMLKPPMAPGFVVTAIIAIGWFASILAGALILAPAQAGEWVMAIGTAFVIWVGFILPVVVVTLGFRSSSRNAMLGDSIFWLVLMLVQAVVLKSIGLVPPPA